MWSVLATRNGSKSFQSPRRLAISGNGLAFTSNHDQTVRADQNRTFSA
jgi:hypothetical protein